MGIHLSPVWYMSDQVLMVFISVPLLHSVVFHTNTCMLSREVIMQSLQPGYNTDTHSQHLVPGLAKQP